MELADHYPWSSLMSLPAQLPPPPSRFVKRGAYMVCLECDLTAQYCMCAMRQRTTESDREVADLEQRVREAKAAR